MKNRIEFASRWKRELYPDSIAEGKEAAYDISRRLKRGRSLESAKQSSWLEIDSGKNSSKNAKKSLEDRVKNSKNKSSFTKKPLKESLADKKRKLLNDINKGLDEAKEDIKNKPPRPKPNVKYKPLPKKPSRVSQLGKSLLKNKGKLALLAGAGTLGAIGYKLYRKARSDKGKKRRFYNK